MHRRHGEVRARVDIRHFSRLRHPVFFIVLHNTQAVDPEVPQTKKAGDVHGVLEGLWKRFLSDVVFVEGEVRRESADKGLGTLAVAQADVPAG